MDEEKPTIDSEPLPIEEVKKNLETEARALLGVLPRKIGTQDIDDYFDNLIIELDRYGLTHNTTVKSHLALTKTYLDSRHNIEHHLKMLFQIVRELVLTVRGKDKDVIRKP